MDIESDPDRPLALRMRAGDLGAFEALVEKYRRRVIRFAAQILRDFSEAEDMAQNAFLRAFNESGRFRFDARFATWLFAIARNLCLNELRRRSRQRVDAAICIEDAPAEHERWQLAHDCQPGPPESLAERELHERLEHALASLPEGQRAAILLLRDGDASYQQIALQLGHSLAATRTLIHRGRHALKRKLRNEHRLAMK